MTRLLSQSGGNSMTVQNVAVSPWMDRRILPILGLPSTSLTSQPCEQRHRYENTITLACHDKDRQVDTVNVEKDFKPTTQVIESL